MTELITQDFFQRALIAGLLVSITCGIMGTYVVINRISFISGGISHASFGGIGIAYYFQFNPILGAFIFALLSAFFIGGVVPKTKLRSDAMIAAMWAIGMATGILFINLSGSYTPDLMSYIFGDILLISKSDLYIMIALAIVVLITVALLFKAFNTISFDKEYAKLMGLPVNALFLILYTLIAMTVVITIKSVGIILIIALLTIPVSIVNMFVKKILYMIIFSVFLSMILIVSGLFLSYYLETIPSDLVIRIPSGATIILLAGVSFAAAGVLKYILQKRNFIT